jgi:hypothetical protein
MRSPAPSLALLAHVLVIVILAALWRFIAALVAVELALVVPSRALTLLFSALGSDVLNVG